MFKEMYFDLCESKFGLSDVSIYLVESDSLLLSLEERLKLYSVAYSEIINFKSEEESSSLEEYINEINIAGVTSFVNHQSIDKAVIFINKTPPIEIPQGVLSPKNEEVFLCMFHYMFLIHELGHAHDYFFGKNYKKQERIVNLVEAEAYADLFTLKYLKASKKPQDEIALEYYAKNVLAKSEGSEFYSKVLNHIKKGGCAPKAIAKWAKTTVYCGVMSV